MNRTKTTFLLLFVLILSSNIKSQDFKLTSSVGFAGYGTPFDGYFFSFDIGIPVVKSVEIVPTFSFYSRIKHDDLSFSWDTLNGFNTYYGNIDSGEISGSFEVFIYINPFKWLKQEKLNKTDFGIGFGYGLRTISHYYYNVDDNNNIVSMIIEAGLGLSYSTKMYYNYHFNKCFLGVALGAVNLNDESNTLIAIQFGVKID